VNQWLKKILFSANTNPFVQFFRYLIVGGAASVVDIGVFYFCASFLGINHLVANTLSFTLGLLINYFLSRQWVFNNKNHHLMKDFSLFALIGAFGLLLSELILFILIDLKVLQHFFSTMDTHLLKLVAKVCAVFIVLFWNYIARKKMVFKGAAV
jgi:putative flippase GtrA